VNRIGYIRTSDSKIDKAPNEVAIPCGISKRITISGTKLNVELHGSHNSAVITKSGTSKEILDVSFLGYEEAIGGGRYLNPKKIA